MSELLDGLETIPAKVTVEQLQDGGPPRRTATHDEQDIDFPDLSEVFRHRGGHKTYGEVRHVTLKCPIFVLTAPDVEGCTTTLTRSRAAEGGWKLDLKLFGNGVSLGQKVTITWTSEFTASAGRVHRLYLPIPVAVQEVTTTFDDGREEAITYEYALQLDLVPPESLHVETLTDWTRPDGPHVTVLEAGLRDQSETELQKESFSYESETAGDVEIGFKAFGADQTVKVEFGSTHSIELAAALAPGHDYRGVAGVWPPYVAWTVDESAR